MKKNMMPSGRRTGVRARAAAADRLKTTLTFETSTKVYHWTTDRARSRLVIKH